MIRKRPRIWAAFRGVSMVHQKGHEKRAGEAGGKARFEGWQGRTPGPGPRMWASARSARVAAPGSAIWLLAGGAIMFHRG